VDLLVSLYEHSTVRMAPKDPQCATITFDSGVAQGSALSPLLFLIFMNALLGLITDRGQKLHISHGLQCGVQLRKNEVNRATEHEESVGQFNLIGFVDDLSLFASALRGNPGVLALVRVKGQKEENMRHGRRAVMAQELCRHFQRCLKHEDVNPAADTKGSQPRV
jgi:hypothetical protein